MHQRQLGDGSVEVGQGQEGNAEDAVLIGEAPVLFQPAVEGPQHLDGGFDVGLHGSLHAHPLGGEEPRRLHALIVHAGQPGVAVEPFGMGGRLFAGQLVAHPGLVRLTPKVVVQRPRSRSHVDVARSWDDRMDPVPEEVAGLAVDVAQHHASIGELRVPMTGERVAGLPIVVVGVEETP